MTFMNEQLQLKAYRVVVSQKRNLNYAARIAHALHHEGFDHCISVPEHNDLDLDVVIQRPGQSGRGEASSDD